MSRIKGSSKISARYKPIFALYGTARCGQPAQNVAHSNFVKGAISSAENVELKC